jgi:hypothetical protein
MTSNRLRNSLTAVLAFTAGTLIVGSAFAADGDNGKFKRRGNNGQLKTGTFQIVVPKADRGGSGRQVAKFVAPKADRTTAQFVAPKVDRGKTGGPTTLFSVSPKAPRTGNGPTAVKFVAPKAPRGDSGSTTAQWRRKPRVAMDRSLPRPSSRSLSPRNCLRPHPSRRPSRSSRPFLLRLPSRPRLRQSWRRARPLHRLRP